MKKQRDELFYLSSLAPRKVETARGYLEKQESRALRKRLWRSFWLSWFLGITLGVLVGHWVTVGLIVEPRQVQFTQPFRIVFDGPVSQEDMERCQADENCMDIETTFVEP